MRDFLLLVKGIIFQPPTFMTFPPSAREAKYYTACRAGASPTTPLDRIVPALIQDEP